MTDFTPLMPHGSIEEVFDDVFFVTGTSRPHFMEMDWQFSRNMTIVRDGTKLCLVNTVRLDDEGLAKLDALGQVVNVVNLGAYHGIDDAFYMDRYDAKLWAIEGKAHEAGLATDVILKSGGEMPIAGADLFQFASVSQPEGILRLDRAGGILISCDSIQNWVEPDRFFDDASVERMKPAGFFAPANFGPGWMQTCKPSVSDFEALQKLEYRHLLSAHGTPLKDAAHEQIDATIARVCAG